MNKLIIKHNELTAEEFILLWEAVHWGPGPSLEPGVEAVSLGPSRKVHSILKTGAVTPREGSVML